jgi:putative ABC transport system substrate-binding protein
MRLIGLALFLTIGLLAAPRAAEAQQAGKVYRVGLLLMAPRDTGPLKIGLRDLGWVENQNFVFEYRSADGRPERLTALVDDLLKRNVDIIVALDTPPAKAAQAATRTVPIVVFVGDPVHTGLVASLGRPGGNITGVASQTPEIRRKSLQLLKEVLPNARRIGFLVVPQNRAILQSLDYVKEAGRSLGIEVRRYDISRPEDDLDRLFIRIAQERVDGLVVPGDAILVSRSRQILDLATKNRLPGMYPARDWADKGGLMSYGNDFDQQLQRVATYVDKILKGAKPADLPVEQSTKFELVINLKTAKALGLTIPQTLLLRADQVIQ